MGTDFERGTEMKYATLPGWDFAFNLMDEAHIMIGGCTGSGKSTMLADLLFTLTAYNPDYQKLILIDLKRVELIDWVEFPHTLKCVTEPDEVNGTLDCLIDEMERRYQEMARLHQKKSERYTIHLVIDELAEVLRVRGALDRIDKLMRLGRASGIHLILATQAVHRGQGGIPGMIWQNVSCRIGLRCTTAIESRQVIGVKGCESLPRYGECYIQNADGLQLQSVPLTTEQMIQERLQWYKTDGSFRQVG